MIDLIAAALIPYPQFDGSCREYDGLGATRFELDLGLTLQVFQDDGYVWLCHDMPAETMGWDDIVLHSPHHPDGINLHASMQLGAWGLGENDPRPENSSSELWWRIEGWWANTTVPNGMTEDENGTSTKWRQPSAREYQLSKDHFGRGEWRLRLTVSVVGDDLTTVVFPEDGASPLVLTVN